MDRSNKRVSRKIRLVDTVKNSRILYTLYYYTMSYLLRFLGMFFKANRKEILFVCYGGRKYGDNVRPIYEKILTDSRFKDWTFTWAFRDINEFVLKDQAKTSKVKIDSPSFYIHALRARCWVTNVTVQRGLNFKNRGTISINTWHGVPLKRIGHKVNKNFNCTSGEIFDLIFAEGKYDEKILAEAFGLSLDKVKITGYPRNDMMFNKTLNLKEYVRKKYHVKTKKIVLYAPTYRDYNKNQAGGFAFEQRLSAEKFKQRFRNSYTLFVRAHGAIEDNSSNDAGYVDVTDYPDVEPLLVAADILITDYSGIMFDYSLLEKPIICFWYDLETYKQKRGFVVDMEEFVPFTKCYTEEEVYDAICNLDYEKGCRQSQEFKEKCGLIEKDATENVVNEIYAAISDC